ATIHLQNPLENEIRHASERDSEVLEGLERLKKGGLKKIAHQLSEWEEVDGLIYHTGTLYIPTNELRKQILEQCHDDPSAGHGGIAKTFELVRRHYWWPRMHDFVKKYIEGCDTCQRKKHHAHPRSILQPVEVPNNPWERIGVDLITNLP